MAGKFDHENSIMTAGLSLVPLVFWRVRGGRSSCHKIKLVPKYLLRLTRAGLVEATRGAGGGSRFSADATRVTLYQVVERFEDIAASRSSRPEAGDGSDVGRALGRVVAEIDDIAVSILKSITLMTLLKTVERHASRDAEA